MPKVYLTKEERECRRFSDYVRGELKRQKRSHSDLAAELNITQSAVTQKINGKIVWTLPEMITTLMFLGEEYTIGG